MSANLQVLPPSSSSSSLSTSPSPSPDGQMGSNFSSLLPFAHEKQQQQQHHHHHQLDQKIHQSFLKNAFLQSEPKDISKQVICVPAASSSLAADANLLAQHTAAPLKSVDFNLKSDLDQATYVSKGGKHRTINNNKSSSQTKAPRSESGTATVSNSRRAQQRALSSPNALACPAQQASRCDESAAAVKVTSASSTEIKHQAQNQQQQQLRQREQKNKDQSKTTTNTQAAEAATTQIKTKSTSSTSALLKITRTSCTLKLDDPASKPISYNKFHQKYSLSSSSSSSASSFSFAPGKRHVVDLTSKLGLDKRMTILPDPTNSLSSSSSSSKRSHHSHQQPHHNQYHQHHNNNNYHHHHHHHQHPQPQHSNNLQTRSLKSGKQARAHGRRQPNRSHYSSTLSSCSSSSSSSAGSCCGSSEYRDELVAQNTAKFTLDPRFRLPPTHHAWLAYAASQAGTPFDHPDSYPEPPPRPWILKRNAIEHAVSNKLQPRHHVTSNQKQLEFTALSYNILSDRLVNRTYFPTSSEMALNWFYRRELILRQLLQYDADIISLQELEHEAYDNFFKPQLECYGNYASLFEPKSRARTMDNHKRRRVDGCAIFYKADKFKLIQRHLLEFNQIAMANAQGSEAMLNRVMTKDNIGLVAVLELTQHFQPHQLTRQRLLVCNTHIHWDPEYCDVKLIQTIMLMNELECIAKQNSNTNHKPPPPDALISDQFNKQNNNNNYIDTNELLLPLLLMGDFNSTPNSGVTSYLTDGKINSLHEDFKNFKYTTCSNSLAASYHFLQQQTNNNTNDKNLTLRRQSSPAWYYYNQSHQQQSSNTPSPGSSPTSSCTSFVSTEEQTPVLSYNHPFKLTSSYQNDIMPYTNFTTTFKAVIDYIFYSQDAIQLLGLLGPLDNRWVKGNQIKTFPHAHLPSDHLPLLAKFRFSSKVMAKQTKLIKHNYI